MRDDAETPIELDFPAHAVLLGVRAIAVGRGDCPLLKQRFTELCGPLADRTLSTLFIVVKLLALKSRRRLSVHVPGCAGISGDEIMLLAAIAQAQSRPGPAQPNSSWMARLTGGVFDPALERSVAEVAELLSLSDR